MEGPSGTLPRSALISEDVSFDTSAINKALFATRPVLKTDTSLLNKPYSLYNQRYMPISSGSNTVVKALNIFDRIQDTVSSSIESGIRYASRDLFFKSDTTDDIDLCVSILDSSRAPYRLECIQKAFLQAGGTKSGTMYPSAATVAEWNRNPTWHSLKTTIKGLNEYQLYGPPVIQQKVSLTAPGVEIFWFRNNPSLNMMDGSIFLGRRIRYQIPSITGNEAVEWPNVSMAFFTSIRLSTSWSGQIGMTSDDRAAVHLNQPVGLRYRPGLQMSDSNSIIALTYQAPKRWSDKWTLAAKQPNVVSGFWFQGNQGRNFSLEYNDTVWKKFSPESLFLIQEAYAPMVSFQVYQSPQDFGADFNFADMRMGGLLMKWHSLTGTPGWIYSKGPLGLPCMRFRHDTSIQLNSRFKLYSFMTMTLLMVFNGLPNNSVNSEEYLYMKGALGRIAIRVVGTGTYGQGILQLYCDGGGNAARTLFVKRVRQGVPYLVVLRINRDSDSDIYSVNGVSMDAEELSILQEGSVELEYDAIAIVENPIAFSNPSSMESRNLVIGNGKFDLLWLRLYDYYLNSVGISREVNNSWK